MYAKVENFGYQVFGKTIGDTWLSLVSLILKHGKVSYDESRLRLAVQNIRIKSANTNLTDNLIDKYADQNRINKMLELTFKSENMYDIDVVPSFSTGRRSYYQRLKEGKLLDFVVKRLSLIPESKKAAIVFPDTSDYEAVLKRPKDDYLPCLVVVQFRLQPAGKGYILNTTFYMRSVDAFQKAHGNLISMAKMSEIVGKNLQKNLHKKIKCGSLDGFIADAHIYKETINEAKNVIKRYESEHGNG
ncbi:MAG: thymidylate synthase [Candidatus Parvarchaeota archaeon]|jgi:thymidylate synthase|nr:thymidylate synthase [Candidatus Parvarchaeota archaeon]